MKVTLVGHAISTLWETFGEQLSIPRTPEKLTPIAETLFRNEEKDLPPAPDDGMEWLNTFTGPNLRFEMMGMVFCFFGMAYHSLLDGDARFSIPENHGRDRKQTTWRMKECADVCLKMCEISETSKIIFERTHALISLEILLITTLTDNEISVALMLCTVILESACTGDESRLSFPDLTLILILEGFQLQRRFADTVVSALAAGLHRLDLRKTSTTAMEVRI